MHGPWEPGAFFSASTSPAPRVRSSWAGSPKGGCPGKTHVEPAPRSRPRWPAGPAPTCHGSVCLIVEGPRGHKSVGLRRSGRSPRRPPAAHLNERRPLDDGIFRARTPSHGPWTSGPLDPRQLPPVDSHGQKRGGSSKRALARPSGPPPPLERGVGATAGTGNLQRTSSCPRQWLKRCLLSRARPPRPPI